MVLSRTGGEMQRQLKKTETSAELTAPASAGPSAAWRRLIVALLVLGFTSEAIVVTLTRRYGHRASCD